jgi:hypothetical protein
MADMDMLEDYLRAVSRLLPKTQREDVIAELRDEILTRIEAKEAEQGRALTPDETEALLREIGHPIVVAARYRHEPQNVVGPAFYPYWAFFVRLAILIEVFASALVFFTHMLSGADPAQALGQALASGLGGILTLIGFATAAAWVIERKAVRIDYLDRWRVRDLRFLDFALWDWSDLGDMMSGPTKGAAPGPKPDRWPQPYPAPRRYGWRRSSTGHGVAAIVFGVMFILWWTGLIHFGLTPFPFTHNDAIDPGGLARIDWAALKALVYWPVIAYAAILILFGAMMLAWPDAVRLRGLIDMTLGMTGLGVALWLWTASPLADPLQLGTSEQLIARFTAFLNHPVPVPLELMAGLIVLFSAIGAGFRILGGLWEALTGAPRYPV